MMPRECTHAYDAVEPYRRRLGFTYDANAAASNSYCDFMIHAGRRFAGRDES